MESNAKKLLEIQSLRTYFRVEDRIAKAVDGVDFDIYEGETLGLVGESGSGKSVTGLSILRLIPNPPGFIKEGNILFHGKNLLDLPYSEMRKIRGKEISMIFQEPMTSLNPVFSIGYQLMEVFKFHQNMEKEEAFERSVEMLELVGIPDPRKRMNDYPHQYSGGMRQRVMIAMALSCKPSLLIADEPTTALDVTIQAQVLDLMMKIKKEKVNAAILLITHDLGVVAETCHRVVVMYGGKIQEIAPVHDLFHDPKHPYTIGLLKSLPRPDRARQDRLPTIPGMVPEIFHFPKGCKFCNRCDFKMEKCETIEPELLEVSPDRKVRCHLFEGQKHGTDAK
ncbi:MAG: ABC transporter ATP-binding protein [Candidatus Brocadiae bacterium]|nr:ABC transporter ATP-binding protein [Candidatus Brocadiia bacterium]